MVDGRCGVGGVRSMLRPDPRPRSLPNLSSHKQDEDYTHLTIPWILSGPEVSSPTGLKSTTPSLPETGSASLSSSANIFPARGVEVVSEFKSRWKSRFVEGKSPSYSSL